MLHRYLYFKISRKHNYSPINEPLCHQKLTMRYSLKLQTMLSRYLRRIERRQRIVTHLTKQVFLPPFKNQKNRNSIVYTDFLNKNLFIIRKFQNLPFYNLSEPLIFFSCYSTRDYLQKTNYQFLIFQKQDSLKQNVLVIFFY